MHGWHREPFGARGRGFTLIEVLLAVMVSVVIIGMAVVLLHAMLSLDAEVRQHARWRAAMTHMADQFRDDVHAARRLEPVQAAGAPTPSAWRFVQDAGCLVEYRLGDGELLRRLSVGDKQTAEESFALEPHTTARIEQEPGEGQAIVSLLIVPLPAAAGEPSARAWRIDAALGKDLRFGKAKEP